MRTIRLILTLSSLVIFSACENYKEENEKLKEQIQQLNNEKIDQDVLLENFSETLGFIQQNLMDIRQREGSIQSISSFGNERLRDAREEVIEDLESIQKMMNENKVAIEKLNQQLAGSNRQNSKLKSLVDQLKVEIAVRDSSITALRMDLESRNLQIAQLRGQMDNLREQSERELREKEDVLNQVFYIAGNYKELESQGIVDKAGGFIGLGRVKTLQDNLDKSSFTQVDKRTFKRLTIGKRKVDLLTTHPSESYDFEMDGKTIVALVIKDEQAFWRSSKTLVILWD